MYKNLNAESPQGEITPRIVKPLYAHQTAIVTAALDLEKNNSDEIYDTRVTDAINKFISNAGHICLKFGGGKTVISIAIALSGNAPKVRPHVIGCGEISRDELKSVEQNHHGYVYANTISVKYKKIIKPTFILVSRSVFYQYRDAIKEFAPSARTLIISGQLDLEKFEKAFATNWTFVNEYDIVLVKVGTASGKFQFDPKNDKTKDIQSILNVILFGFVIRRVIYDDADVTKFGENVRELPAIFTWYVSATEPRCVSRYMVGEINTEFNTTASINELILRSMTPYMNKYPEFTISSVCKSRSIPAFDMFKVMCRESFVESSLRIPKYRAFKYVLKNPNETAARLIGAFGDDEMKNLLTLINGDAVGAAAARLGIVSNSASDIFSRLLGAQYDIYKREILAIRRIETDLKTALERDEETKKIADADIEHLIRIIAASKHMPKTPQDDAVRAKAHEALARHKETLAEVTKKVDRLKSNIKEGECQVCVLPIGGDDAVLTKCCCLIMCSECSVKGTRMQKRYDHVAKKDALFGKCPNCAKEIDLANGMIYVDKQFDIESIIDADGVEEPEPVAPKPEASKLDHSDPQEQQEPEEQFKSPKQKILYDLVRGIVPDEQRRINLEFPNLIKGNGDVEKPADVQRKLLVYAANEESIDGIQELLKLKQIKHLRLTGKATEIKRDVEAFRTGDAQILLLNTQYHCSGLNLEFASDVVFFHAIDDPNVEAQVCGRVVRIGVKWSPNIHFLFYENENKFA